MAFNRLDPELAAVPAGCTTCIARDNGICSVLLPDELVELARNSRKQKVDAGCALVSQGDTSGIYANVLQGVVKLSKMMSDGRQQIVGLKFAPNLIGEFISAESSLSAESSTDCRICSFPRAIVEKLSGNSATLERRMHHQALNDLEQARDWMLTLGRKTAVEKVASFIVLVSRNFATNGALARELTLPLTRAETADYLGLTIETVSRQLTKLRGEGIITLTGYRLITIDKPEQLLSIAETSFLPH